MDAKEKRNILIAQNLWHFLSRGLLWRWTLWCCASSTMMCEDQTWHAYSWTFSSLDQSPLKPTHPLWYNEQSASKNTRRTQWSSAWCVDLFCLSRMCRSCFILLSVGMSLFIDESRETIITPPSRSSVLWKQFVTICSISRFWCSEEKRKYMKQVRVFWIHIGMMMSGYK